MSLHTLLPQEMLFKAFLQKWDRLMSIVPFQILLQEVGHRHFRMAIDPKDYPKWGYPSFCVHEAGKGSGAAITLRFNLILKI